MKILIAVSTSLVLATSASAQQPAGPRVFISVDMEGLAGVVAGSDVSTSGRDYAHFREIMAGETNAAIEGAAAAGASYILVRDSHGAKMNLLPAPSTRERTCCAGRVRVRRT
jgi:D-amino peptidase